MYLALEIYDPTHPLIQLHERQVKSISQFDYCPEHKVPYLNKYLVFGVGHDNLLIMEKPGQYTISHYVDSLYWYQEDFLSWLTPHHKSYYYFYDVSDLLEQDLTDDLMEFISYWFIYLGPEIDSLASDQLTIGIIKAQGIPSTLQIGIAGIFPYRETWPLPAGDTLIDDHFRLCALEVLGFIIDHYSNYKKKHTTNMYNWIEHHFETKKFYKKVWRDYYQMIDHHLKNITIPASPQKN